MENCNNKIRDFKDVNESSVLTWQLKVERGYRKQQWTCGADGIHKTIYQYE